MHSRQCSLYSNILIIFIYIFTYIYIYIIYIFIFIYYIYLNIQTSITNEKAIYHHQYASLIHMYGQTDR